MSQSTVRALAQTRLESSTMEKRQKINVFMAISSHLAYKKYLGTYLSQMTEEGVGQT
jgi:hypothetical protein